jgi:hypothetical protein
MFVNWESNEAETFFDSFQTSARSGGVSHFTFANRHHSYTLADFYYTLRILIDT